MIKLQIARKKLQERFQYFNEKTGGRLNIIKLTFENYSKHRSSRAAAGMTYYTLFSLFPLLIIMVTVASFFVDDIDAIDKISQVMTTAIPVSTELVQRNIYRVVDLRRSIGFVGLIGFAWSASNAFSMLADHINHAFPSTQKRSIFKQRLVAFGILGTIVILLIFLILSSTLINLITQYQIPFIEEIDFFGSAIGSLITKLSPWLFSFILFISLYLWVPNTEVQWKAAFWSGLVVMFLWRITSVGFSLYLSSGLTSYEIVYGSLSAIVILLLWVYLSSLIIFWGAHLCAAINQHYQSPNGIKAAEPKAYS